MSKMDGDPLRKANAAATQDILHLIKQRLEASSTLEFTDGTQQSLAAAITPGLELLQSLHNQLEDYGLESLLVNQAGKSREFEPRYMEDGGVKEAGSVKVSLFPVLYKTIDRGDGTKVSGSLIIITILLTRR